MSSDVGSPFTNCRQNGVPHKRCSLSNSRSANGKTHVKGLQPFVSTQGLQWRAKRLALLGSYRLGRTGHQRHGRHVPWRGELFLNDFSSFNVISRLLSIMPGSKATSLSMVVCKGALGLRDERNTKEGCWHRVLSVKLKAQVTGGLVRYGACTMYSICMCLCNCLQSSWTR